jgi:SNF2 family DNA or RNA helicase
MEVKSGKAWQQQMKKLAQSYKLEPKVPETLQAQLRDYQLAGYDWASRLSHWGAGACLADDMGLGKTLQALAIIVDRASKGPTLVLAPTSVSFNWQDEAAKFSPTLKVKLYGMHNQEQRDQILENAEAFDLIICSYGLLQTQGEKLAKVHWQTLIADEAQALKNPQTKRSKIANTLTADFKMITTGTPIENNLTELWSLFRFINPGLFGSLQQFTKRFVQPIENANASKESANKKSEQDNEKNKSNINDANEALRKIIAPFMLRRLKTNVLTELPSRTEINIRVELSEEESALYEAIRQKAIENLMATDEKAGQKRIKVLAEIMRLRRACCHPKLVFAESDIADSKLKVFDSLVTELKQGGHKALVFSQFVGHLAILKQHLTDRGISFQYLDGSTSLAKRKKAVTDFQAGVGDVFLISLKAGGSGLNLTAADYVIHMDPWWNPAVEDQASDRAHRMGQTRPVTIYRLITQHTIEDKIVALHQQKRDLASSLLEGTDTAKAISLDDMMNLLKNEE